MESGDDFASNIPITLNVYTQSSFVIIYITCLNFDKLLLNRLRQSFI